jgi:hypothetical protein
MQWYVDLIAISAPIFLAWVALELLGRPIRELFDLRRKILEQTAVLGNIPLPKPRENAVSSQEIRDYDQAMRNVGEARGIFCDLGSQLLAFGENEPAIRAAVGLFGLNIVAAGRRLIDLSETYLRPDADRAGLRNQIEKALRVRGATLAASYQYPQSNSLLAYQTKFICLRDISSPT